MYFGRNPERKFCDLIKIGYREIAFSYDVHADQEVNELHITFCNPDALDANRIRQDHVDEVCVSGFFLSMYAADFCLTGGH